MTKTVTLVSWLLLCLDVTAIFVTTAFNGDSGIFGRIVTWNYHSAAPMTVAVIATAVMVASAVMTRGLRGANLVWLRVWIGGVVVSVVAVIAMLVAVGLMLLIAAAVVGAVVAVLFGILDS